MKSVDLGGALQGLRPLEPDDLERYKEAVVVGQQVGFGYYFPGLLTKSRPGASEILIGQDNDSLCLFRWSNKGREPRLDVLFAPMPLDLSVLQRCIERANQFNGNRKARILRIDEKDTDLIAGVPRISVRKRRPQYLYNPDSFQELSGRKFRTIRRNVSRIEALSGVHVEPYKAEHYDACFGLLKRWREHHRTMHGTQGGYGTSRRLLGLAESLAAPDMLGEIVIIEDKVAAFAFGGEIRPGVGAFLEAKSDPMIPGLSYFQRYSFLRKQNRFALINDGSDTGREGLRQLKESLRPVGMHTEFSGAQA